MTSSVSVHASTPTDVKPVLPNYNKYLPAITYNEDITAEVSDQFEGIEKFKGTYTSEARLVSCCSSII